MKPKIFVTRKIPHQALSYLEKYAEVAMWEEEDIPVPREVLEKEIETVDGLYCLLTDKVDEPLIKRAKQLKVISNMAVGYNNIDIRSAANHGIIVTNTPDVLTETTADLTFALLMATARRLVESQHFLHQGKWQSWSPMLLTGQDIFGATIGIIGLGRIGEAVARRAKGFDMNVLYYNRRRKPELEARLNVQYEPLNDLLAAADFICILTPYTDETRDLISDEQFKLMKASAIVINTSRGGIVNENALYRALVNKEIWAAGLDVFEEEPVPLDHPLLTLPNVVALPHIGSASIQTRVNMAVMAAKNLIGVLQGNPEDASIHKVNRN
ncbi:2-hydroxyacid dehydrogenase [Pullulanibacillus camelliae]|uniref:2-hydroxyacid dehydrogenase n=1 Tax=Pullulanibacillus camelliae TaxID=1707096 RepID=UPI001E3CC81C|nr:D-glycerate dehydrogenase [Pullulanibacillus camelliae]